MNEFHKASSLRDNVSDDRRQKTSSPQLAWKRINLMLNRQAA